MHSVDLVKFPANAEALCCSDCNARCGPASSPAKGGQANLIFPIQAARAKRLGQTLDAHNAGRTFKHPAML